MTRPLCLHCIQRVLDKVQLKLCITQKFDGKLSREKLKSVKSFCEQIIKMNSTRNQQSEISSDGWRDEVDGKEVPRNELGSSVDAEKV